MTPDPKWLEILKASGWQTTGLACAFGVFLLLPHFWSVAAARAAGDEFRCHCLPDLRLPRPSEHRQRGE